MSKRSFVARILGDPVFVFFAIGVGLFAVFWFRNNATPTPVVLSASSQAVLVAEWEMLTGRSANAEDAAQIVNDYYQRELLFREGLKNELYQSDPSVRELIIERMQQQVTGVVGEPSGKELVNYYTDHIDRYYSEATISFSQRVFQAPPDDSEQVRRELNQGGAQGGDASTVKGIEAPWQGTNFPNYGVSMIRGLFGQPLLDVLEQLPTGGWEGPYESRDGWHYFRVEGREKAALLAFSRVRDQVLADYQAAAVTNAVAAFVEMRRSKYPLILAP